VHSYRFMRVNTKAPQFVGMHAGRPAINRNVTLTAPLTGSFDPLHESAAALAAAAALALSTISSMTHTGIDNSYSLQIHIDI
jgi:predicted aconitase